MKSLPSQKWNHSRTWITGFFTKKYPPRFKKKTHKYSDQNIYKKHQLGRILMILYWNSLLPEGLTPFFFCKKSVLAIIITVRKYTQGSTSNFQWHSFLLSWYRRSSKAIHQCIDLHRINTTWWTKITGIYGGNCQTYTTIGTTPIPRFDFLSPAA